MAKKLLFKSIQQYLILLQLEHLRQSHSMTIDNHQLNPEDALTLALIRYHFWAIGHSKALKALHSLDLIDEHHHLTKLGRVFIEQDIPHCMLVLLGQFVFHIVAVLVALFFDAFLYGLSWLCFHASSYIGKVHIGLYGGSSTFVWSLIGASALLLGIFLMITLLTVAFVTLLIVLDPHAIPYPIETSHATKLDFLNLAIRHPKDLDPQLNISLSRILTRAFNAHIIHPFE